MTSTTPMLLQWRSCKEKAGSALLFFRLGDFYEAFEEDALVIAKELELTLTKRQEVPMCGVPFHTCETYIDRLVAKGYRVAIAEQLEDPGQVKGIVKREVVRLVTPGTLVTSSLLRDKANNFVAALTALSGSMGLALLDVTTADFRVFEFSEEWELLDELHRLLPKELLLNEKCAKHHGKMVEEIKGMIATVLIRADWHFDHALALQRLQRHFHVHTLDGFGVKGWTAAINAAGALLSYVQEELHLNTSHIRALTAERLSAYMSIDRATERHLELFESQQGESHSPTLLSLLDETSTPMGGRLMRQWLSHPLQDVSAIAARQTAIASFLADPDVATRLAVRLKEVRDLERLIMRIATGYAAPRDLTALCFSLEQIPEILQLLHPFSAPLICENRSALFDPSPIAAKIGSALVAVPPLRLSEGGIFQSGYNKELDALRSLMSDSRDWIARYQMTLREETGIKTLKVGFTKAFGYYIEASRGQSGKIPPSFTRRQTLVNAERFITAELKEYEEKVLTAEEKSIALEQLLFHELRAEIAQYAEQICRMGGALAQIDCLLSLAQVAARHHYVCPTVDTGDLLEIKGGRHPVIAAQLKEQFIPNDLTLGTPEAQLILLTGPNMAGKSTYIRQTALIAILAHIGSFVPAEHAHIGLIDKVFSRIGASDDLARGQSTFMVEMAETANILHNATQRSLVILDEIGRGTSTYDGISIAWAVAEYLLTEPKRRAKTLFATHYFELTSLEKEIPGALNFYVAVHEGSEGVTFLHKIVRGSADKSYGIHVARLAGLPAPVIERAQKRLQHLENSKETSQQCRYRQTSFL